MIKITTLLALAAATLLAGAAPGAARIQPATVAAGEPAFRTVPPPPSFPADSADSLYRAARQALNDGRYQRAAELFQSIVERYPKSAYAADALYWRAFALYQSGGSDDLHQALDALDRQRSAYPDAATRGDAATLATRIRGELARRGDQSMAQRVAETARTADQGCASEDDDVRAAALNALMQMDADQALPILRKVLARRDACSEGLRKKAVFLVAQTGKDEAANLLMDVVRSDPSAEVRGQAVFWLGQVPGDRAVSLLDSVLRSSRDEDVQRRALFALSQHSSARAQQILRDLTLRPGVSEELKGRAIFALGQARDERGSAAFLRELYPKLTSERLKERVLQAVAQRDDAESRKWLLGIALDTSETIDARKKALFWAGQQGGVSTAELARLYDTMPDREIKEQLIFVLSQRDDAASIDKLIDIARHEKDRDLRKKAVFWLGQRDDPRVRQLLEELINGVPR